MAELKCPLCEIAPEDAREGDACPEHPKHALLDAKNIALRAKDSDIGRMLAGKYGITGVIGSGGFGHVYRGIQLPVRRPVAVKLIRNTDEKNESRRTRFFREARLVARLSDPASVTLHDYGEEDDGTLYMVFELVEGLTLDAVMAQGPMEPMRVAGILAQVLRALAEAHEMGVVHRDLKPGNVMVVRDALGGEGVRVLDYGIAKNLSGGAGSFSDVTQEDMVVGTPRYMSPEQARNETLDNRTDIYSLGVLSYAMLAGEVPFDGDNPMTVLVKHLQEPVPHMRPTLDVPPALEAFVRKALSKSPGNRYQNVAEMLIALGEALPGMPMGYSAVVDVRASGEMQQAFEPTIEASAGPSSQLVAAESLPTEPEPRSRLPMVIAVIAVLLAAGVWLLRPGPDQAAPRPVVKAMDAGAPVQARAPDAKVVDAKVVDAKVVDAKVVDAKVVDAQAAAPKPKPPRKVEPQRKPPKDPPKRPAAPKKDPPKKAPEKEAPKTLEVPEF